MQANFLGHTDIKVSLLCLGTMTWGEQNSAQEAFEQLDYAIDQGINFIDTAELYPVPPSAKTYTKTETIIGHWLKDRGCREKVVIATKIAGNDLNSHALDYIRGGSKFNQKHLFEAVDNSLNRLQTDYIDLYQLHWPERNTNFFGQLGYSANDVNETEVTPILETLEALHQLVKIGKIRSIGLSNETPWGTSQFLKLSEQHELPKVVSVQNPYNLLNRSYEIGMAEISHREAVGLLAYSPLGFGVLSGKYCEGDMPEGSRLQLFPQYKRYFNPHAQLATLKYVNLAKQYDLEPAQMALAYVNSRPFLTSNIIGATSLNQLKKNIASVNIQLSNEIVSAIENIHQEHPNPAP